VVVGYSVTRAVVIRRPLRATAVALALTSAVACATNAMRTVPQGHPTRISSFRARIDGRWTARNARRQGVLQAESMKPTRRAASARREAGHEATPTLAKAPARRWVFAINEFREFLTFYPTHSRADYAQYKLGLAHFRQMRAPQRDQSETRETIKEFETFVERYPNSSLMPEVRASSARLGSAERIQLPGRIFLFPATLVRRRIDRLKSVPQGRSGVHALMQPISTSVSR